MLIRWLTVILCRNEREMRVVKRVVRVWQRTAPEDRAVTQDRRVTRRARLSLLWALLTLSIDSPNALILGVFSMCGLIAVYLWRLSHYLWSLI